MSSLLNPKKSMLVASITLISVSLYGYLSSDSPSLTALIPLYFGSVILILSLIYNQNNKLIAHLALGVLLLSFVALFMPLSRGGDIGRIFRLLLMQIVCLYSMICFFLSFIRARRK